MTNRRRQVEIFVRLPKELKIKSLDTGTIPLDENFMCTVRENHRNIGEMRLREARRKFG